MTTATKRKATTLKLKIVTIDELYDLTIIVGTSELPQGQKAFRINKRSLRSASPVWAKMLNGQWPESSKSEIEFPDDSSNDYLIVLRIAHFQLAELPAKLTRNELLDLATFTDKYHLEGAVRIGLELKKWMEPYKSMWKLWPANTHLQEFATVTCAFELQSDSEYLTNRLATEVRVDEKNGTYYNDNAGKKIPLLSNLPPAVVST